MRQLFTGSLAPMPYVAPTFCIILLEDESRLQCQRDNCLVNGLFRLSQNPGVDMPSFWNGSLRCEVLELKSLRSDGISMVIVKVFS